MSTADSEHRPPEREAAEPVRPPSVESSIRRRLAEHDLDPGAATHLIEPGPEDDLEPAQRSESRYIMRGEVARGGMGAILKVWDSDLRRSIAMKIVLGDQRVGRKVDASRLNRFLEEAQVTGQLDHPGVVPVHELGIEADGRMYFTMRFVRGQEFEAVIAKVQRGEDNWTLTRALGTLLRVCETMAFAHSKGVVHRDLKPANIMVGQFGETYVMDWGLAKVVGRKDSRAEEIKARLGSLSMSEVYTSRSQRASEGTPSPYATHDGAVIGTPYYMPPEQAAGRLDEIGPASDVYSVGCILYQLLTGKRPYERDGDALMIHTLLAMVVQAPPTSVAELAPSTPGELIAICEKAMAHDWKERYPSMLEMAHDVRAYLEGHVVKTYESGPIAEFKKWIARHRSLAAALGAIVTIVVASTIGFIWLQNQRVSAIRQERDNTTRARLAAEASEKEALANEQLALHSLYATNILAAEVSLRANETQQAKRLLADCAEELRGWEWRHLARRVDTSTRVYGGHGGTVNCVAIDPQGKRLLSGAEDGKARLWDLENGQLLFTLDVHDESVVAVAFNSDSSQAITIGGWSPMELRVWSVHKGEELRRLPFGDHAAHSVALGGERIAIGTSEGRIKILELSTGMVRGDLDAHSQAVKALAFSADGKQIVSGSADHTLKLWDIDSGAEVWATVAKEDPVRSVAFHPQGGLIASGWGDGVVRLNDAASGESLAPLRGHTSEVEALAFNPSGSRLVSGSLDKTVVVWNPESGAQELVMSGHDQPVHCVAFGADGNALLSGSEDQTVRLWRTDQGAAVSIWNGSDDYVTSVAFGPDSRRLLAGTAFMGNVALMETQGANILMEIPGMDSPVTAVRFSPDGRRFAWGGESPEVHLWDLEQNRPLIDLGGHSSSITSLAFSFDGRHLISGSKDHKVRRVEVDSPGDAVEFTGHHSTVNSVHGSPDGSRVVSADTEGRVILWEASTGDALFELEQHPAAVLAARFSPDGTLLATGCADNQLRLWNASTGALVETLRGHDDTVTSLDFSPDGLRIVSGSYDKTLRIWDTQRGRPLVSLRGHSLAVMDVAFSPDGRHIASASFDNTVRLWHASD